MTSDHVVILALAKEAIKLQDSPMWNMNPDGAAQAHGEACDRVWAELQRQLGAHDVPDIPTPPSPHKQMLSVRNEVLKRLKERLPEMIEEAIGKFE